MDAPSPCPTDTDVLRSPRMGMPIGSNQFPSEAAQQFDVRLRCCLAQFSDWLRRFQHPIDETMSIGAETELHLVDAAARPAPLYEQLAARANHLRLVPELARYNVELNATPIPIKGRPFAHIEAELLADLRHVQKAAQAIDVRLIPIGILPTVRRADLGVGVLSQPPRFQALNRALKNTRSGPRRICIDGHEPLSVLFDSMAIGATTAAFQIHLRVPNRDFVRAYNAAQLASSVALATSVNSPLLLGHQLWHETRIPLLEQYTDDRQSPETTPFRPSRALFGLGWLRQSPIELFEEAVALFAPLLPDAVETDRGCTSTTHGAPSLPELRLHNSTIWRWNRPVYSDEGSGHLRIELRTLPSGPSVPDMVASAAFLVGLTIGLMPMVDLLLPAIPFEYVRAGFYRAAQHGLAAELPWPAPLGCSPQVEKAGSLAIRLLPVARAGLLSAGVDSVEADSRLELLRERVERRLTGAAWQISALQRLDHRRTRSAALARLVDEYFDNVCSGEPLIHWRGITDRTANTMFALKEIQHGR